MCATGKKKKKKKNGRTYVRAQQHPRKPPLSLLDPPPPIGRLPRGRPRGGRGAGGPFVYVRPPRCVAFFAHFAGTGHCDPVGHPPGRSPWGKCSPSRPGPPRRPPEAAEAALLLAGVPSSLFPNRLSPPSLPPPPPFAYRAKRNSPSLRPSLRRSPVGRSVGSRDSQP